jgi:hypothetical protein
MFNLALARNQPLLGSDPFLVFLHHACTLPIVVT